MKTSEKEASTGVHVVKGHRYRVDVVDMRGVYDLFVPVRDLNGWPWAWLRALAKPLEQSRRQPCEPWFSLIATVDCEHPLRMTEDHPYEAPATGQLICYFNDVPSAYWNNFGVAHLRLIPLDPVPHKHSHSHR